MEKGKFVKLDIEQIRKELERVLVEAGVNEDKVNVIVEDYIEAELEGKTSHGLRAFPSIFKRIDKAKDSQIKILNESDSSIFLDADQEFGQVVSEVVQEKLKEKAKKNGFAIAMVKNMQPFLRPGFQARKLAQSGLIGIVTNSTKNLTAPFGGFEPILGTNPLGLAFKFEGGMVVSDFATSKRANGESKLAKLNNSSLPHEVFFDEKGDYTDDPDSVYSIDVFGGYKGFALSLLIEVLTGSLLGTEIGEKDGKSRGAVFIAIDPSKFGDKNEFLEKNSKLVNRIKVSKPRKGENIYYPGERSNKLREENLKRGYFEVDKRIIDKFQDLGLVF